MTRIFVDGNPNEVCCVVASDIGVLSRKVERARIDGENTNNIAEYRAVLFGLHKHPEATEVCSDSQLVVKQLNGEYAIKQKHLQELANKVRTRVEKLGHEVKFVWVRREDNPAGKILG